MKCSLPVIGMACSACSANVERKLNSLPGVNKAVVNLPGRSAFVDFDEQKISLAVMKKEINDIGYDLVIETDRKVEVIQKHEYSVLRKKVLLSWLLSVIVMAVSMKWLPLGGRECYQSYGNDSCIGDNGDMWRTILQNWLASTLARDGRNGHPRDA